MDLVHQLKVTIKDTKPRIWRRVVVPSNATLAELHDVIQAAFGWTDCHLHEFRIGENAYGPIDSEFTDDATLDEAAAELQDVADEGDRFEYVYDFGDNWRHEIRVEAIDMPLAHMDYPGLITGERACPPEDCGGTGEYARMLCILSDPDDPEHADIVEWLGPNFDPDAADLPAFYERYGSRSDS